MRPIYLVIALLSSALLSGCGSGLRESDNNSADENDFEMTLRATVGTTQIVNLYRQVFEKEELVVSTILLGVKTKDPGTRIKAVTLNNNVIPAGGAEAEFGVINSENAKTLAKAFALPPPKPAKKKEGWTAWIKGENNEQKDNFMPVARVSQHEGAAFVLLRNFRHVLGKGDAVDELEITFSFEGFDRAKQKFSYKTPK